MRLADSVILVTGSSRGIGLATARLLAERGATVVCSGRDETALSAAAAAIGAGYLVADLTEPAAAQRLVKQVLDEHGRLDGLVANAGVGYVGDVAQMPAERITELVDLDLRAPLLLARAAAEAMPAHAGPRGAAIVFLSSIAAAVGVPEEAVYSACKVGLETFAELLAEQLRGRAISVSTVLPGVVDTDFLAARQVPYERRFPRPMPAERVARVVVEVLESGRRRRIEPRWLVIPARLAATAPGLYRRLARRLS